MKIHLFVLSIVASFGACGGSSGQSEDTLPTDSDTGMGEAAIEAPPACEEDDAGLSLETAKAIPIGDFKGCLLTTEDFYKLRAPDHAPGTAFNVKASGGATVTIFDAKKAEITSGSSVFVALAGNTDSFVRIAREATAAPASYELTISAQPLIDEDEPNDSLKEARPLNMGKPHDGLLQTLANNPDTAKDFYRVLVGRRGQLTVEVDPGTDELTIDVTLLRASGEEIERSQASNAGGTVKLLSRVKSGEYVIKVSPAENPASRAAATGNRPRHWTEGYSIVVDVQ